MFLGLGLFLGFRGLGFQVFGLGLFLGFRD